MTAVFESGSQPPPDGSDVFIPDGWDRVRDAGIRPLNASRLDESPRLRGEFVRGSELLRLHGEQAWRGNELKPQNLRVADALNAGHSFFGLVEPRRSSKTTTLFAFALGRVASRENYLCAYSMLTTALKARERFRRDVAAPLEALYPDKRNRPFRLSYAGGYERVEWENGSLLAFLAPKGAAFRSDAWDLIIADEGGEADPEMSEDVLAGALATMDTRPEPLLIVAGTAAKYRKGNLLWDTLEDGRQGLNDTGIVEYAAPPETSIDDIATWEQAAALLVDAHPGIDTLTTLERIEPRFRKLKPAAFLAEYLSIFGEVGGAGFVDQVAWARAAAVGTQPAPPERFVIGVAVHHLQTSASIVAAWRDEQGRANVLLLGHASGSTWLRPEALRLARKYRVSIVYDSGSASTMVEVDKLARERPKPRLEPQPWATVSTAASLLYQEIQAGNFVHWGQEPLSTAARVVVKRGTANSKRWAFGRADEGDDITPFEAASLALRAYDEDPPRASLKPVMAS